MPDVSTEVAIATTTLSSTSSTITFSSIPSTYTDLRLVWTGTAPSYLLVDFNGDTAANYSYTWIDGSGSAAASGRNTNDNFVYFSQRPFSSTIPQLATLDIFSYTGSTFKTSLWTYNQDVNGSGYVGRQVALYRSTSAISSIRIFNSTMGIGTTATLYGIL